MYNNSTVVTLLRKEKEVGGGEGAEHPHHFNVNSGEHERGIQWSDYSRRALNVEVEEVVVVKCVATYRDWREVGHSRAKQMRTTFVY